MVCYRNTQGNEWNCKREYERPNLIQNNGRINQYKSTGTPWGHVVWKFETIWTKNTGVKKKKKRMQDV